MTATLAVDSVDGARGRETAVTCLDCAGTVRMNVKTRRLIRLVEGLARVHDCPALVGS